MPCELGVASLSAPRPASLGLPSVFALGILATGLLRVLAADRAAFGIPFAVSPPLTRFGGGISSVSVPAGPLSPRGCSASRWRFPRVAAGENVATSPVAAGMGQEYPLAHPARGLQAPVLAMLAKSSLYVGGGAKILTSWLQIGSHRALAQPILLRLHVRRTKAGSHMIEVNRKPTPTRPDSAAWIRLWLGSCPAKSI
jgi:hypothetical protein